MEVPRPDPPLRRAGGLGDEAGGVAEHIRHGQDIVQGDLVLLHAPPKLRRQPLVLYKAHVRTVLRKTPTA